MKKIIKKITVMAVMSLFAATQLQTPQVNVQAADGVATAEKTTAKQPKIYGRSGIVIDAKSGKILYAKKVDDRHYPSPRDGCMLGDWCILLALAWRQSVAQCVRKDAVRLVRLRDRTAPAAHLLMTF